MFRVRQTLDKIWSKLLIKRKYCHERCPLYVACFENCKLSWTSSGVDIRHYTRSGHHFLSISESWKGIVTSVLQYCPISWLNHVLMILYVYICICINLEEDASESTIEISVCSVAISLWLNDEHSAQSC